MDYLTMFLLAIGLSFDTFAVSVTCGLLRQELAFKHAVRIAVIFALFQAISPLIGWLLGSTISKAINQYDHWLAFGLLFILGVKMLIESQKEAEEKTIDPMNIRTQVKLAIATSIDALIVGLSFAFINVKMVPALLIIGIVTFIIAMLGMLFGKKTRGLLGPKIEMLGGIILIVIGCKILWEHLAK
jgi:manganese efflux pump family protein